MANNVPKGEGVPLSSREVVARGVGLRVVGDPVWRVPRPGAASTVRLSLQLTNRSKAPLQFALFETMRPMIVLPSGAVLETGFSRDALGRGAAMSKLVPPGRSIVLSLAARLTRDAHGGLMLSGDDGFGGIWTVSGFEVGRMSLAVRYVSDAQKASLLGDAVWAGDVRTASIPITVET